MDLLHPAAAHSAGGSYDVDRTEQSLGYDRRRRRSITATSDQPQRPHLLFRYGTLSLVEHIHCCQSQRYTKE